MTVDHTCPSLLHLHTTEEGPAAVGVTVTGELDAGNSNWLRAWVADTVTSRHPATLTLDLSSLHFIDVAGVRTLYELHASAAAAGCALTVGPAHEAVRVTLSRLGLDPEFGPRATPADRSGRA
ncbi:STAS domain-containing protein [Actinoplanes sp. URMC 104]|uniref:STAS domain-containing protein n=1 Tax=Actinoplanes sp. URMC 104 TaxID=3423409 RepID=UPI003F1C42FA